MIQRISKLAYPFSTSLLFALIYAESTGYRIPVFAALVFVVVLVFWLVSYALPPLLFPYSNELTAPEVLSRLLKRAAVAVLTVVGASVVTLFVTGLWLDLPFIEELYAFTLIGIVLFHGFGGPFAHHVVYLQLTKQYNSNQLAAVLVAFSLMLFVLTLFFLNLDFGAARDAHVQVRDLLLLTTVLLGYGSSIYKIAHH